VLRVDLDSGDVAAVFTDDASIFTSAQFSPHDGRMYLTDFSGGKIGSITPQGDDHSTFFTGSVEGKPMNSDDLAFDQLGNMYVSDSAGYDGPGSEPSGRVVRINRDTSEASVLARNLPPQTASRSTQTLQVCGLAS
jgi:lactonase